MTSLFDRFNIHLSQNYVGIESKKLLLGISGGLDSMVLLDLLLKAGLRVSLAHCNFGLRGDDSDRDEDFVRDKAAQYQVPLHVKRFNTREHAKLNRSSIQMAARDLRYEWFDNLLKQHGYDYLMTAHHADDNLETFFINLSRGTGIDGLCGIPERSGSILRPLLIFGREEIYNYAMENHLIWREDQSNQEVKYLRNKIRHNLMPLLKELNPSFRETFMDTLNNLKGSREIIRDHINLIKIDILTEHSDRAGAKKVYKVEKLKKYAKNSAYLYQIFHEYGFNNFKDIQSLLSAQSGKQLFSNTHRLIKHGELLLLTEIYTATEGQKNKVIDQEMSTVDLDGSKLNLEVIRSADSNVKSVIGQSASTACFDHDLLHFPLSVRKWEKGDYFYPLGMRGKKKLSKFFKDEKYSVLEKENIWLLCSGCDIIWVIGKRMDNRYKLSNKTTSILKATLYS